MMYSTSTGWGGEKRASFPRRRVHCETESLHSVGYLLLNARADLHCKAKDAACVLNFNTVSH